MNANAAIEERMDRERRLYEIRREAEANHASVPVADAHAKSGYYGTPVLKRPQWTAEVPVYFFVGGMAGAAAVIGAVGRLSSVDERLVRHSRWLAAIGGLISPALLIADLGVPSRFLNMLRVFKVQSPMSVGSWTLVAFSNSAAAAAVFGELEKRRPTRTVSVLTNTSQIISALTGLILSTYTGVLLAATAIPAWNERASSLPIHFAASGTAAAAGVLEIAGNRSQVVHRLAIGAALIETAMGASIEFAATPGTKALREGISGRAMRGAGMLSGPVPLALRLFAGMSKKHSRSLRLAAAWSAVAGSLLTRWAWVHAGKMSADDPRVPLQLEEVHKDLTLRR